MLLGNSAANTLTTFRLPFCPETLLIVSAGVPQRVQVRALGEGVILDLDATGLPLVRNIRNNQQPTNHYSLVLADGLLKGKNIEIDVTSHASNASTVYCYSSGNFGNNYVRTERVTILANTAYTFRKFFALGLSAVNNNDQITINYRSGLSQLLSAADELQSLAAERDFVRNTIDNLDGEIDEVTIVPTAQITVYRVSLIE